MSVQSGTSGALEGAGGGALAGAAFGPVGAGIGAGIGGLAGLLDGLFGSGSNRDQDRQALQDYINKMGGMQAPQAGPARFADPSQYEGQRQGYLNQLRDWMLGNGPSAALNTLKTGLAQNVANQGTLAASAAARGGGANATRMAQQNSALMGAQETQQAAVERAAEQQAAAGMYGQALDQGIGQTQQLSEFNAGEANQLNLADLQSKLTTLGITSRAQLEALLGQMGAEQPSVGDQLLAGGATAYPLLAKLGGKGASPAGAGPGDAGLSGGLSNPFV